MSELKRFKFPSEGEKPNLFRKISLWWKFDGKYIIPSIKQGLKNLYIWTPIIWKDRNWDYNYIFTMLENKLKLQSEYIGGREIHTRAKRDAEIMMTCVRLIDKVKEQYYQMEYFDYHESEMYFEEIEGSTNSRLDIVELSENFDEYFKKYPLVYKLVTKTDKFIFNNDSKKSIAMNIAHHNHNRARKLLFNLMEENIEKWWD